MAADADNAKSATLEKSTVLRKRNTNAQYEACEIRLARLVARRLDQGCPDSAPPCSGVDRQTSQIKLLVARRAEEASENPRCILCHDERLDAQPSCQAFNRFTKRSGRRIKIAKSGEGRAEQCNGRGNILTPAPRDRQACRQAASSSIRPTIAWRAASALLASGPPA